MYYDDMGLDELPISAYDSLKDSLSYMDEEELKEKGLPEDRIEFILSGGEPDASDMEIAFGGIVFVPDDFGWFKYYDDIEDDVYYKLNSFLRELGEDYSYPESDLSHEVPYKIWSEFVESIAKALFKNQ